MLICSAMMCCVQVFFCVGTRRYGVPGNENDESIVCMSVMYLYDKLIMAYRCNRPEYIPGRSIPGYIMA